MGAVKIVNLKAERGDTIVRTLTFKDDDGVAIDITGWTIYFTIKSLEDDADASALISKTVTIHTTPTSGLTKVTVTAAELDALVGKYYYDYQYKNAAGEIKTIIKGTYTFGKDITRRVT